MTTARSSDAGDAPPRPSGRSSRPPRSRTTGASSSTSSSDLGVPDRRTLRTFSGGRAGPRAIPPVGRVGRPHGLDGSFHVVDASPDLPAEGGQVTVRGIERTIVRRAGTGERPILRLSGAVSREDAERLIGAELRALVGLGEDEFWASDLEGCAVVDGED